MNRKLIARSRSVAAAVRRSLLAASLVAPLAGAAFGADEAGGLEEVIVTGSRIANPNLTSPSPVQTLTSEDIAVAGVLNVQDLLLANPTFGTPLISRTNSNFQTSAVGVATVDLRNLGVDRTLTLVDGRRFVSGLPGSAAVDYNTIPAQFIDRIDVLTGGASAVYGSDAVAGVVNIIYKKNFEGIAFDAQYGISEEGDNEETQVGVTFGVNTGDGRGNVMAHLGYTRQDAVFSRDRERSAVDQASVGAFFTGDPADLFEIERPFYSSFAPQGRFFTATGPADGITYDLNGNIIPWNTNGSATQAATGFNRSEFRTIAVPVERYLFAGRGSYEFAENHSAFFEGTYAASNAISELEPYALGSFDIYPGSGGQVPAESLVDGVLLRNPVVPDEIYNTAADEDGDGLRDYYFSRRMSDFGNRGSEARRDTFRLVGGVQGGIGSSTWNYEGFLAYGQTKEAQTSGGQVNVLNFRYALEAIPDVDDLDEDGNTTEAICRDATARAFGCVPANVFGYNSLSPEAINYIRAPGSLTTFTSQTVIGVNTSGELFDLPAGPLAVAVGGEYREERSNSEFDALQQAGLNAGNAIPPTRGSFNVIEGYLEAAVPLLRDVFLADSLSFRGAVRFSDYSTVGNTVSWNAGIEWSPIPSLRFRAIRALSTRAPNITELYEPLSQDFPNDIQDPCIGVTATSSGPTSEACRAAPGVNANIAANGSFTLNQADLQGITGFDGGNPDLHEEKGNSWTIGLVVTPEDVPVLQWFNFTVDYFRIDIDDAIVVTDRNFILSQCYGGGDASMCDFVTRRPAPVGTNSAGSIDRLDTGLTNSGGEFIEGIDFTIGYAQPVGPGRLSARLSYTHTLDHYQIPLPGADPDYLVGEVGGSRDRANLAVGYDMGRWGGSVRVNYLSSAALDDQFLAAFDVERNGVKVGSKTYVDAQVNFSPTPTYQLFLGVNNLFDTEPPPIITGLPGNVTGAETDSGTYDAIGRRYYAGVRVKF